MLVRLSLMGSRGREKKVVTVAFLLPTVSVGADDV